MSTTTAPPARLKARYLEEIRPALDGAALATPR